MLVFRCISLLVVVVCSFDEPVDDTDPLRLVGQNKMGVTYDLFVSNDLAYVSNNDGVTILDISDRTNPKEAGRIKTSGWFRNRTGSARMCRSGASISPTGNATRPWSPIPPASSM